MAMQEIDAIGAAIAATEKEIFTDAFEQEELTLDETGDRTVEQMGEGLEGQHEPDDDDETEDEESEAEDESDGEEGEEGKDDDKVLKTEGEEKSEQQVNGKTEPKPEGRVPSGKLREEADKRRAAEAELATERAARAEERKEIETLKTQFQTLMQTLQRQPAQPKPDEPKAVEEKVDLFENPDGFVASVNKRVEDAVTRLERDNANREMARSFKLAHVIHKDTFEKAWDAINKLDPRNPDDRVTVQRIHAAPDQGEALIDWYKRAETLRVVGDDPTKFLESERAKMREELLKDPEVRKQIIQAARSEAGTANNGEPNTTTRIPRSLNQAEGGNRRQAVDPRSFDDSDQAVFASAFQPSR